MRTDGCQRKEDKINDKMQIEFHFIYFTLRSSERKREIKGVL